MDEPTNLPYEDKRPITRADWDRLVRRLDEMERWLFRNNASMNECTTIMAHRIVALETDRFGLGWLFGIAANPANDAVK